MQPSEQILAIRRSVALSRLPHVSYQWITGTGAFEALNRVFSRELYVRDGQLVQGLLLDGEGHVYADCVVARDDDDYFLLAEGPDPRGLAEYLSLHARGVDDFEIVDRTATHDLISLDGPYAWELVARLVGQEVVGLPYMTFFHLDGLVCCRSGKTGEYGYVLIVDREHSETTWNSLVELGRGFDAAEASLEALDVCALENWFFNVRREGRARVTPIELQLQWRLSRKKSFVGSEAVRQRLEEGLTRRATTLLSKEPFAVGDQVSLAGRVIGDIVNAAHSPVRGEWVGLALLDLAYAHPGITTLRVGPERTSARTVSPPVLQNRSLYVNPQVHSYASREEDEFPSLVVP